MSENDGTETEFHFIIDTPKPLSLQRIGEYMVQFGKLLGVPARLVRIEQTENAECSYGKTGSSKEPLIPEKAPNAERKQTKWR